MFHNFDKNLNKKIKEIFLKKSIRTIKMTKKVIITGGLGFIGSHIVRLLLRKNYKVLNLDKISYSSQRNFNPLKNYNFKKQNIASKTVKDTIIDYKPDFIINCAAETHVDRSITNSDEFIKSNILGTHNILESCLKLNKCKLIHISTDEVFGSLRYKDKKFSLDSPYDPKSPYSASKASADHLVRSYGHTYGLNFSITNCSNNYGPYQYPEKLIPLVINACINKKTIPIYGNGKNIRDWIYVEDHARAIISIMKQFTSGKTYLIGGNCEKNNLEVVKIICETFKKKYNFDYYKLIRFVKDRKGHDFRYAINNYKTINEIKWKPKINFRNGINKTINFYIENKDNLFKIFKFDKWIKKKLEN